MENFIFGHLPYIIGGILDNADNGECSKSPNRFKKQLIELKKFTSIISI